MYFRILIGIVGHTQKGSRNIPKSINTILRKMNQKTHNNNHTNDVMDEIKIKNAHTNSLRLFLLSFTIAQRSTNTKYSIIRNS